MPSAPTSRSGPLPPRGVTLTELLVVIAIIGLLVSMLLPAVQMARESARRSQCANNLRQLGIAVHAYEEANSQLPPGAAGPKRPFGTGSDGWGVSWMVYILPMIEEGSLFSRLTLGDDAGCQSGNASVLANVRIPSYACPSSPLPLFDTWNWDYAVMAPHYVGIAGAAPDAWKTDAALWAKCRVSDFATSGLCCASGRISGGGTLIPNGQLTSAFFKDGRSMTLAISEQGDYLVTNTGVRVPWRGTGCHGFLFGGRGTTAPPAYGTSDENRAGCVTTIRYAINNKDNGGAGWAAGDMPPVFSFPGGNCSTGVCWWNGANTPLNSAHAGGITAAFADASVRFVAETIDMVTLSRLAIRDDGGTVPEF